MPLRLVVSNKEVEKKPKTNARYNIERIVETLLVLFTVAFLSLMLASCGGEPKTEAGNPPPVPPLGSLDPEPELLGIKCTYKDSCRKLAPSVWAKRHSLYASKLVCHLTRQKHVKKRLTLFTHCARMNEGDVCEVGNYIFERASRSCWAIYKR